MFLDVMYKNKRYKARITLRESLFQDLKDSNPNFEVEILSNETGKKLFVQIKDLVLYSIVRSL